MVSSSDMVFPSVQLVHRNVIETIRIAGVAPGLPVTYLRGMSEPKDQPAQQQVTDTPPATPPAPAPKEIGGPKGPEPTRYGDWEVNGRCTDF